MDYAHFSEKKMEGGGATGPLAPLLLMLVNCIEISNLTTQSAVPFSMERSFSLTTTPNLKLSQLVNPAHNCTEFSSW